MQDSPYYILNFNTDDNDIYSLRLYDINESVENPDLLMDEVVTLNPFISCNIVSKNSLVKYTPITTNYIIT